MLDNIVDMTPSVIIRLMEAASHADVKGARMRICTGVNNDGRTWVKWDCGRGWTEPYFTQEWAPPTTQSCAKCNYLAEGKWDGAASVSHSCGM